MAANLTIPANQQGEYRVRASVAGVSVDLVVDTGFTHAQCRVGVCLAEELFDLMRSGLTDLGRTEIETFGRTLMVSSGTGMVSLEGLPETTISTRILRAGENILRVCYFHRLPGFALHWDFGARTMTIAPGLVASP